ncbi:GNAT family N-acetyltransferase [Stakelama tenebrarum]|uniref:GNAT family N-acetyltransferase n=1 Tax=Stakelama tenebrarum TaxID=2711215 RepID=A0A6G6Y9M2_9SPHN|nr:GNAT family N-acetyltransferase [Sphingosinithalassobacter tenebrarum]QIG81408.1 GNAT family N-acetyltransferase [Sphingosinithalassobacter tenebrarum]
MEIRQGGLDHPDVIALLELHFAGMLANSPCGSCHFLDLSGLATPDVTFWTIWDGETLLGCGAVKEIAPDHGEIKSMRTAPAALRRGVGRKMLAHILKTAGERGYARLSLETGTGAAFDAAHALYRAHGFEACGPFGDYVASEFNVFMTKVL